MSPASAALRAGHAAPNAEQIARGTVRAVAYRVAQPNARARIDEHVSFLETRPTRWLRSLFPNMLRDSYGRTSAFADRHLDLWRWVRAVEPGRRSTPFIAIWPRGGAKSTSVELAVAYLGATRRRRYVLYVCRTQRQANDHVGRNVAGLLQSPRYAAAYPDLGQIAVTNLGQRRGWTQNRLFTASGFKIDAIGLNAASRGVKIDADRPDLIVFDDIDEALDSPGVTAKMIATITKSILPAGAGWASVMGAQNLIHPGSVFAKLANREADFLIDANVSGPHVAVDGLEIGYRPEPSLQDRLIPYVSAGTATWAGQSVETCNSMLLQMGVSSFMVECQQEVDQVQGSMFEDLDLDMITVDPDITPLPEFVRTAVWCDPAVTSKDRSDANGIAAGSLGVDGRLYVRRGYERRSTPLETLRTAIMWAVELGAETVGVETDQGGDTWEVVYEQALDQLVKEGAIGDQASIPFFDQIKAGAGFGPKQARAQQLHAGYRADRVRHVVGPSLRTITQALARFPLRKPFDFVDALYWLYNDLILSADVMGSVIAGGAVRSHL